MNTPVSKGIQVSTLRNIVSCTVMLLLVFSHSLLHAQSAVTVARLNGESHQGELLTLNGSTLVVRTDDGDVTVPVAELMQVELTSRPEASSQSSEASTITVTLVDQSIVHVNQVLSDGTTVSLTTEGRDPFSVPVRQLRDIRFAASEGALETHWQELQERNVRDDLLVFQKGDVLDYSAGSVGQITDENVTMLIRNRELAAPRPRVFGVIFASRGEAQQGQSVLVQTHSGEQIRARSVALDGEAFLIQSASLGEFRVPLSQVSLLDYGGGRIRYLAEMPFDESASKAPATDRSVVWFVSRNAPAGSGGKAPLTIGHQEYHRGLWLHSGAQVRYRLNREFAQLRATAGFEKTHVTRMPRFEPRVRLVVLGDSKELYSREYGWNDPAEPLEIDLRNVRELTLKVESLGKHGGILEHFALGDAQVIRGANATP